MGTSSRHSAPTGSAPAAGLVAYHVIHDQMNYLVADLGRGALQSLHENPKWKRLQNEGDALVAAVTTPSPAQRSAHSSPHSAAPPARRPPQQAVSAPQAV